MKKAPVSLLFGGLCTLLLFLGFAYDLWGSAEKGWFLRHQLDMESHVLGRLVKSRSDGLFSAGALNGLGSRDAVPVRYGDRPFEQQYAGYVNGLRFGAFSPYFSENGGQGLLFSALDRALPFTPAAKLELFRALTALLGAAVLASLCAWVHAECGWWAALPMLAAALACPWLTVFGRNLYWSLWAFYLPMACQAWLRAPVRLAFGAILLKCLINGYDYITTTVLMMLVPLLYRGLVEGWKTRTLCLRLGAAAAAASGAVLASALLLWAQIALVKGSAAEGLRYIAFSLAKRTHGDAVRIGGEYAASLQAGTWEVVRIYLEGPFRGRLSYSALLALFALAGAFLVLRGERRARALALAALFSLSAPLSWFVLFKAHSFMHPHLNFLVWQMPFSLLGFALCGLAARRLVPFPLEKAPFRG